MAHGCCRLRPCATCFYANAVRISYSHGRDTVQSFRSIVPNLAMDAIDGRGQRWLLWPVVCSYIPRQRLGSKIGNESWTLRHYTSRYLDGPLVAESLMSRYLPTSTCCGQKQQAPQNTVVHQISIEGSFYIQVLLQDYRTVDLCKARDFELSKL